MCSRLIAPPPSVATDDLESRKIFRLSRIELRIVQSISLATITTELPQNTIQYNTHVKYSFRRFYRKICLREYESIFRNFKRFEFHVCVPPRDDGVNEQKRVGITKRSAVNTITRVHALCRS